MGGHPGQAHDSGGTFQRLSSLACPSSVQQLVTTEPHGASRLATALGQRKMPHMVEAIHFSTLSLSCYAYALLSEPKLACTMLNMSYFCICMLESVLKVGTIANQHNWISFLS
jgi:hypothetical protein